MGTETFQSIAPAYRAFIESCAHQDTFRLTPRSEPSAYALCFAIFGYNLIGADDALAAGRDRWSQRLRSELQSRFDSVTRSEELAFSKPFLQLLAFTLSAFAILKQEDPLAEFATKACPVDIASYLDRVGVFRGAPTSGNFAMLSAILLLHLQRRGLRETAPQLDVWQTLHLERMNECGFWGPNSQDSYRQFQNGYHQHEIFRFLGTRNPRSTSTRNLVMRAADDLGHFAPYPGGGGCYDFDAVFLLTDPNEPLDSSLKGLLRRTRESILTAQNADGGFGESALARSGRPADLGRNLLRALGSPTHLLRTRLKKTLAVGLHPKHARIPTHWTQYSREWNESDLWDSWFRLMTVAYIEKALGMAGAQRWRFIDFPGIGFHPQGK